MKNENAQRNGFKTPQNTSKLNARLMYNYSGLDFLLMLQAVMIKLINSYLAYLIFHFFMFSFFRDNVYAIT